MPHEPRGSRPPLQPVARTSRSAHSTEFLSRRRLALLVLAFLALAPALSAQAPAGSTPGPAVGESRDTGAYTLAPEKYRQAVSYSRAKYRLHFIGFAWGCVALLGLLALRVAPRFRDLAERASSLRFVQALVFVPLLLMTLQLLGLPLDAYRHHLARFYDQSVQSFGSWLWDWTKELLVTLAIAIPVVAALYAILRKNPRRWWLTFWLGSLPVIVFLVFISPLVIDPLFFRFEPLAARAPDLVTGIEQVTKSGGLEIPSERMFLMKASDKLKSVNAYVTGFGASKRIVVWDTALARMTTPQTLFVFGHEMGHYVLGHIFKTILFLWALLLVLLFATHLLTRRIFRESRRPFGIRDLSDWASLPLLLLVLAVASELALPIANAYSRGNEHAADVYGIEVIHDVVPDANRAAAEAFQVLGEINLADPSPSRLIRFWLYSHPPLAERLAFARTYDPWSRGEPPRYVRDRTVR
ncbi:MAG TPA: M48 family metallopeptidase [Thermoanaerobaculia bacterium]|nr:M48 family metallopeptidase [Thermoanaerobaculia bacterium]